MKGIKWVIQISQVWRTIYGSNVDHEKITFGPLLFELCYDHLTEFAWKCFLCWKLLANLTIDTKISMEKFTVSKGSLF